MQRASNRLELIDFLRGIAILEMLVTHFSTYFPPLASKVITYTETAMALFVLLAGFMVGRECQKFAMSPKRQTIVLWKRALRIVIVQCVIIVTVGVPLHLLGMPGAGVGESLSEFLARSVTLQNQIGLIHILPTFIPLFAVSPLILWALSRNLNAAVLTVSVALFCLGHYRPYLLDLGDPTIFPFLLFQLYFVIGCTLGTYSSIRHSVELEHPKRWFAFSVALLAASMFVVHSKVLPPGLVSTHPLNLFGLAYHVPIILALCLFSMSYLSVLQRVWGYSLVTRFGRHALLAFVLHLYLAKVIGVLNHFATVPAALNYILVLASVAAMDAAIRSYEARRTRPDPPGWTRAVGALFR